MPLSPNARIGLVVGALGLSLTLEGALLAYLGQRNTHQSSLTALRQIPVSPTVPETFAVPGTGSDTPGAVVPGQPAPLPGAASPARVPSAPAVPAAPPPKNAEAKKLFDGAMAALKKGELKNALAGLQAALKLEPDNMAVRSNLALVYNAMRQPKQALVHLQALVKLAPKDAGIHFELAKTYLGLRQLPEAETQLREVIRLQPKEKTGPALLAQVLVARKKPRDAYAVWQQMAKNDPKDVETRLQLAAVANDLLKQPKQAESWLKQAAAIPAGDPRPAILLSQLYMSRKQPKAAVQVLADAVKREPKVLELYPALAEARAATGDLPGATTALKIAIDRTPKPESLPAGPARLAATRTSATLHLAMGRLLGNARKIKEAKAEFQKVIQLAPQSSEGYSLLARTQFELKDRAGGVQSLKKALALDPKQPAEQRLLAQASLSTKDWKQADASYAAYTKLVPQDADAYVEWAQMWMQAKQPEKALSIWDKVAKAAPKSPIPYSQRANLYQQLGRNGDALANYRKAAQLRPEDPEALYGIASLEAKTGDHAAATKGWMKLIEVQPDFADAYLALLDSAQKSGEQDSARTYIARALAQEPERKEKLRVLSEVLKYYDKVKKPGEAKVLLAAVVANNPKATTAKEALSSFGGDAAPAATPPEAGNG